LTGAWSVTDTIIHCEEQQFLKNRGIFEGILFCPIMTGNVDLR